MPVRVGHDRAMASVADPLQVAHLTREQRVELGKAARQALPLADHAVHEPAGDRPDPVDQLEAQAVTRIPDLVPIRYGRMSTSPFAFYRGAALLMATDLGARPTSGLRTQLCGDAHLSNFGVFGSPERRLVFDLNDFDETLPGPFEWDVKRFAASLEIAGRENGFSAKERRQVVLAGVAAYRSSMRDFATQTNLAVWYASLDIEAALAEYGDQLKPASLRRTEKALAKARTRDSMQALKRLTTQVDGHPRIVSDPPLVVPIDEMFTAEDVEELYGQLRPMIRSYRRSLQPDLRALLEQFRLVDMAHKVVGVGSVGTRAWILLMEGVDGADPMFLQAKEAQASVLEQVAGRSTVRHHGQRVVLGQRLMQASSDIFLGWQTSTGPDGVSRDFYLRQLRDWKVSVDVERMVPSGLVLYARLCGWTLARAHARSGDRIAIAAYLGKKDTFEHAVADFATAYADQNARDSEDLTDAISTGRVTARTGV
jgi:uncharacterized protein (DUF2252 family)